MLRRRNSERFFFFFQPRTLQVKVSGQLSWEINREFCHHGLKQIPALFGQSPKAMPFLCVLFCHLPKSMASIKENPLSKMLFNENYIFLFQEAFSEALSCHIAAAGNKHARNLQLSHSHVAMHRLIETG